MHVNTGGGVNEMRPKLGRAGKLIQNGKKRADRGKVLNCHWDIIPQDVLSRINTIKIHLSN